MTLILPPTNGASHAANASSVTAGFDRRPATRIAYWIPALAAGAIAWLAFMLVGGTPIVRASGLALVIGGMAMALRPMGRALSVIGALALAFSPAFWTQTGGLESLDPGAVAIGAGLAVIAGVLAVALSRRAFAGVGLAVIVFAALFFIVIGTPRSLRLNTLMTAWLLYVLIDALIVSNPRPDEPPTGFLGDHHAPALLVLMTLGVLNDPMFTLLAPAVALGLFLTKKRLSIAYWLLLLVVALYGGYSLIDQYYRADYWLYTAIRARVTDLQVPYFVGGAWRDPARWLQLIALVGGQFTTFGVMLGIFGLARLSRWYPPVGVVTLIAYGAYVVFGLIYFGGDAEVLLLPLLMIQIVWMTYAVHAVRSWARKSAGSPRAPIAWFAPAAFVALPLIGLARIMGVM